MIISKTIEDDKKEKHNSITLTINVPTIDIDLSNGGWCSENYITYTFYAKNISESETIFNDFMKKASSHYNKHIKDFDIISQ